MAVALPAPRMPMGSAFQRGDPVRWNSEAGRVAGRVVRAHARGMTPEKIG